MSPTAIRLLSISLTSLSLAICRHDVLWAETFRHITAEPDAGATIEESGNLKEGDFSFRAIYKPDPRADWCKLPWISTTEAFRGKHSIGMEINRKLMTDKSETDKVNLTLSTGRDKFALTFGSPRYTGFAIKLPSKTFEIPEKEKSLLIFQWWQGVPYGPPLRLAVTSDSAKAVSCQFRVKNDDTLGNPTAKDVLAGSVTIPFDAWTTFVVYTAPDFAGKKGEVRVWMNGKEQFAWKGKLGYDPGGKPYKGASEQTPHPNKNFDIFYGPYRARQARLHQVFFDEIKLADKYSDAVP